MKYFSKQANVFLVITMLLAACNSTDTENVQKDTVTTEDVPAIAPKDSITTWKFDADRDIPVASGKKYFDTLTAEELVAFVSTDKVILDFIKHSGDTIFVRIKDSEHLSQRMGTTGAKGFMSVATFTLTELKGTHYVNFDFTEGDHAVPGTYSREEFKEN